MLKELHNREEIEEFFDKLDVYNKTRFYGMAYRYSEIMKLEEPIRARYRKDNYYKIEEIFIINDNYQIVKIIRRSNEEVLYDIFVDYKPINEITEQFDTALTSAIAYKYTRSTTAALYFGKMIDMELR